MIQNIHQTSYEDIRRIYNNIVDIVSQVKEQRSIISNKINEYKEHILNLCDESKSVLDDFISKKQYKYVDYELITHYLDESRRISNQLKYRDEAKELLETYSELDSLVLKMYESLRQMSLNSKSAEVMEKIDSLDKNIKDVSVLKEKIKNQETHDIYDLAAKKNKERVYGYRVVFLVLIILVIILVWFSAVLKEYLRLDQYDYWFFKITLAITSITLITFYLKLSTKYQNIADQCEQTKLELEAFPTFVASFSTEDPQIIEIRKELALKYFGRDLVNNDKAEASNIITDQMKNTTELVKATTEAIKNLNTKTGGTSGS